MHRWLVPTLLLIVVASLVSWFKADPQSARAARKPQVTAPPPTRPPAVDAAYSVLHGSDLAAELERYDAVATASQRERLHAEVDAACRAPILLTLDGRGDPDPRRDPSRRELERRCADLPVPSMYAPDAETEFHFDDPSDAQSAASALERLRAALDADELAEAWMHAYRVDALPQDQIFADRRRLLPAEAELMIRVVIDWRECARLDACGTDSLLTLRVCALHGCEPGSDLRDAWHRALAPRDFESALAIYSWLQRLQEDAAQ